MARSSSDNSILSLLVRGTTTIQDFSWDTMTTAPILSLITAEEIDYIRKLILSPRYSGNNKLKMSKIDEVMFNRGFSRFAGGTNRLVYTHPNAPNAVFKIAIDSVGINDNPAEFRNQQFLKPYCCKVFECSPCGTIASFEKVERITTFEEFYSIADDYFYILSRIILGKYVMEDIGIDYFMNVGIRKGCHPVILDFPYLFELDGRKLECGSVLDDGSICGGDIDYDAGFNKLVCKKCGRIYQARDLALPPKESKIFVQGGQTRMSIKLMYGDQVIIDETDTTVPERSYLSQNDPEIGRDGFTGLYFVDPDNEDDCVPVIATADGFRIKTSDASNTEEDHQHDAPFNCSMDPERRIPDEESSDDGIIEDSMCSTVPEESENQANDNDIIVEEPDMDAEGAIDESTNVAYVKFDDFMNSINRENDENRKFKIILDNILTEDIATLFDCENLDEFEEILMCEDWVDQLRDKGTIFAIDREDIECDEENSSDTPTKLCELGFTDEEIEKLGVKTLPEIFIMIRNGDWMCKFINHGFSYDEAKGLGEKINKITGEDTCSSAQESITFDEDPTADTDDSADEKIVDQIMFVAEIPDPEDADMDTHYVRSIDPDTDISPFIDIKDARDIDETIFEHYMKIDGIMQRVIYNNDTRAFEIHTDQKKSDEQDITEAELDKALSDMVSNDVSDHITDAAIADDDDINDIINTIKNSAKKVDIDSQY